MFRPFDFRSGVVGAGKGERGFREECLPHDPRLLPISGTIRSPVFDRNYQPDQIVYSNGIDCSGLVMQSIGYLGSGYVAQSPNLSNGRLLPGDKVNALSLTVNSSYGQAFSSSGLYDSIEAIIGYLVPGDYIAKDGHVMLISDIDPNWIEHSFMPQFEKRKEALLGDIKIVQASAYKPSYQVGSTNMGSVMAIDIDNPNIGLGGFQSYSARRFKRIGD